MVVDHDTGRLVWAAAGNDKPTLALFFESLGPDRCARITHVSADAAAWIARTVQRYCPGAIRCADPFHVVVWATGALDQVRRTCGAPPGVAPVAAAGTAVAVPRRPVSRGA